MDKTQRSLIIFGASDFARLMAGYIERFTDWRICAYTVDDIYAGDEEFMGKPLVPLSLLVDQYPPDEHEVLVAVGYKGMGDIRKRAFTSIKALGYAQPNFIHPEALCYASEIGEGNIILERAVVSVFSVLENANLIWNGCQLAHELTIGSFNTFGAGAVCAGQTSIGDNCFFGIASSLRNNLKVASYTFVGAGCYVNHSTQENEAFISESTLRPQKMPSKKIMRFFELSE